MVSNLVVADGQLLSNFERGVYDWLTVKSTEDEPVFVIAVINLDPHPFILAAILIGEFDFYVVTRLVCGHGLQCKHGIISPPRILRVSHPTSRTSLAWPSSVPERSRRNCCTA